MRRVSLNKETYTWCFTSFCALWLSIARSPFLDARKCTSQICGFSIHPPFWRNISRFPFKFKFYSVVVDAVPMPLRPSPRITKKRFRLGGAPRKGLAAVPSSSKYIFLVIAECHHKVRASSPPQFSHITAPTLLLMTANGCQPFFGSYGNK